MSTNADELALRVSVATLNRVVFRHPENGMRILALERKATVTSSDPPDVYVRAQPFGGAVRLLDVDALRGVVGDFQFDSERSRAEQDFRVLIRTSAWDDLKAWCVEHLRGGDNGVMETTPSRELIEEFAECTQIDLKPPQFVYRQVGMVAENAPTPTDNIYSRGMPTVRLYSIFEVTITDDSVCQALVQASDRDSDAALGEIAVHNAQRSGRGRANSVLTMAVNRVTEFYRAMVPEQRYAAVVFDGHRLDQSVLPIIDGIEVPQLEWIEPDAQ